MNYLVTMSGAAYDIPTEKIVMDAPRLGNCKVLVFDDQWMLDHGFLEMPGSQWLLGHPQKRGFYWYFWKPLLLMYATYWYLDDRRFMAEQDVIMWNDADSVPVKPFDHLFDQCRRERGILLFRANGHKSYQWTKRDCYAVMGQDEPKFHARSLDAGVARFCFFEKGSWTAQQFLAEWLTYTLNPKANTFDPSTMGPEDEGFQEHRCEQAIMTLLAHKYGLALHPELDYEQGLFNQENPRPVETRQTTAPILGSRFRNV